MIIRNANPENYTLINYDLFKQVEAGNLSYEEIGMLTFMLSRPNDFKFTKQYLVNKSPAGKYKVETLLKSLTAKGYVRYVRERDKGAFAKGWYDVRDSLEIDFAQTPTQE
jgi:hypothetical protein